ncbi:DUF4870 domain-containing protein [Priestia aryabhattai]|jgi:uncharacterized Tic20 family protein|uniref:DUF4870 domain-containing protein n=1 Tax=Priestia aryabhattai TaxID=412384 RepID=UPI001CCE5A96|nr:DUF4870 domain-containing protein [Priestia aryabhattai]MBZ6489458.1 DUF4870 domain-containing protein [Priestia aryabhattai]MDH3111133.1 DUF4870 domain-containing protein [Priestia aryabhattai]MDH3129801.1 DUF4870 domain-containing protein [Priestia aryabhattai]MDH3130279.1 DUF4870 domain-containing protein [Priestia aryabhattai]
MNQPKRGETIVIQLMLGCSLVLGVFPPLLMFLLTRKKNHFYREASRKALNFHLTIFPFFLLSYFMPSWYKYVTYGILGIELIFILNVMIRIALRKSHSYPIAITYIKNKEMI